MKCMGTTLLYSKVLLLRGQSSLALHSFPSYMKAARLGDVLEVHAECLKLGKTLAFTTADVIHKADGDLIATGRQTKHIGT